MNEAIFLLCLLLVPSHLLGRAGPEVPLTNPAPSQEKLNQRLNDAILAGSVEEVKKTVSAGADVNYMDSDGKTPVWLALLLEHFDILHVILEFGGKGNVVYRNNTFAQAFFDQFGQVFYGKNRSQRGLATSCLSLLIANEVDFSKVRRDQQDITDVIFDIVRNKTHFGVSWQVMSPLIQQMQDKGYKIVEKIWDSGQGVIYQDKDIVQFCLKNGISINQDVTRFLSTSMAHYNQIKLRPMPALFIAVIIDKYSSQGLVDSKKNIETLLSAGADINSIANPDGSGPQTPLDWALANASSEAIRILMQRGAKTYKQLQAK